MSETLSPAEDVVKSVIDHLLKQNPQGFSISASGDLAPEMEAVEIKSMEQFAKIAREPKVITISLYAGRNVQFKVRPLDVDTQREIDKLENEAPAPPKKQKTASPSLARGRDSGPDEYDYRDKEYLRLVDEHLERKRTATIFHGLLDIEIPGETLEQKQQYLSKNFPPRILDAIAAAIRSLTTDTIERALFH